MYFLFDKYEDALKAMGDWWKLQDEHRMTRTQFELVSNGKKAVVKTLTQGWRGVAIHFQNEFYGKYIASRTKPKL